MQKLLTVAVPCYNSQEYMRTALESILPAGDKAEVLIVDDGSTDGTAAIAAEYAGRYPDTVRVIRQENGGHGAAVNTGLREARGLFFRVVDSDDWLDRDALLKLMAVLEEMHRKGEYADLVLTNYIYDHGEHGKRKLIHYRGTVPAGRMITWDEVEHFPMGSYILMHAATYRTGLLRDSGLELPGHTFYVDNIFVYVPMALTERLYYLDADLYHYILGRPDQSVNEAVMTKRIRQQLRINRIMLESVDLSQVDHPRKREYMLHYLEVITMATTVFMLRTRSKENEQALTEFLTEIRDRYPIVYEYFVSPPRWRHLFRMIERAPRIITVPGILLGYRIVRSRFGFN